jgi:hypothetical protein
MITLAPPAPPPRHPPDERRARFFGAVRALDCEAGTMILGSVAGDTRLRLLPTTQFLLELGRGNRQPTACSAIRIGDRVEGSGRLRLAAPGAIDAEVVIFRRMERPHGSGPDQPM